MLNQLIRQEAVDAYSERWLGEVSAPWALPPLPLALTGLAALISVTAILVLGSYTRQTTIKGVIKASQEHGFQEEVTFTASRALNLHAGGDLPLEMQSGNPASQHFAARITSIASTPGSGESFYRVGLQIPSVLHAMPGTRFHVRVPLERRHLYQWMFSCSPN